MRVPTVALGCGLALAAAKEHPLHQPAAAASAAAASGGWTVEHTPPHRGASVAAGGRPHQQQLRRRKRRLTTGHRCCSARKSSAAGSGIGPIPCFLAPLGRCGVGGEERSTQLQQHPHRRDRRPLALAMRGRCVVGAFSDIGHTASGSSSSGSPEKGCVTSKRVRASI